TVPPGTEATVDVMFDATGLFGGDYRAHLQIDSNDPDESPLNVPVTLHVTGAPDIAVTPPATDFGPVFVGPTPNATVVVRNAGIAVVEPRARRARHPDAHHQQSGSAGSELHARCADRHGRPRDGRAGRSRGLE